MFGVAFAPHRALGAGSMDEATARAGHWNLDGRPRKTAAMSTLPWAGRLWRMSIDWSFAERHDDVAHDYFVWTAPEALRCGDRLALYEGGRGNRSSFIGIGRAVTDSVRAHRGDRRHWAWVEWVLLSSPRAYSKVADVTGYAHVSGSHARVDEDRYGLWTYLTRDGAARPVADDWRRERGFPTTDTVPIHLLFDAKWRYRPRHEVSMYQAIEDALIADGCAPAPEELSALVRTMRGGTPTQPAGNTFRRPDVWVLAGRRRQTLVVVEVKQRARHMPDHDYDPVAQVTNYVAVARAALSKTPFRRLTLKPMVVAYEFDEDERAHARAAGVECRVLMRRTRELRLA